MIVTELTHQDRADWDAYVRAAPGGLPQHLSAWRDVLEATYGYRTRYLLARDEKRNQSDGAASSIVGVMPLFLVPSFLTGRTLSTMPGGLCADNDTVAQALIARATEIADACNARRLVVQDGRTAWTLPTANTSAHHEAWLVDVSGSEEELSGRLHRNIRRQIRMAEKNGLTTRIDRSGETADDFYAVLSRFTHQSGTPVFGRSFVANVVKYLGGHYNIVTVYHEEKPIGSYFQLEMAETVYGVWGATLHEYLNLRPVYLAYWEILADANRHGFTCVDMGRSPAESNASKFKRQWGGESVPIFQQTISLNGSQDASVTERTQSDGRLRSFMQIWPHIPFPVAQFLGPKLRRHVPFA